MAKRLKRLLSLSALIAIVAAVPSCGEDGVKKTSSQVAAKVNGDEISVHQINNAIARGGDIPPGEARQAAAQALERIIDQELLVQRAVKAKLDRDPRVMQAIEGARRRILARAYVERIVTAASTETKSEDEIRKFYKDNPALFERRRIYGVHELIVIAPQEQFDALKAAVAGAQSLYDVRAWLESRKLPFHVGVYGSRPAEQIPLAMLPLLLEMRSGQIAVLQAPRGASVIQLLQSREAPLSERQAMPIIERYLLNRKRIEVGQAEVRKLREHARIDYVGEFKAPGPARPGQPAASGANPGGSDEGGEHIKRGVAGLR
ncbi:MAG: peptidyl-prolyl cis-trans isomerase, EpsD family [Betaproteobacteria bacterium]|nr:peptidyl-prolyl cis-trans isomerase, EpsD family [Betaproteobacteria bacterium]